MEIVSQLDEIKEANRTELIDILDSYFDPEKETIAPVVKKTQRRRRTSYHKRDSKENRRPRNGNKNGANSGESDTKSDPGPQSPDSQKSARSPRRQRRNRRRFSVKRQLAPEMGNDSPTTKTAAKTTEQTDATALPTTIVCNVPAITVEPVAVA